MDRFSHLELRTLIEQSKGQCISIYLPTHRVKEEAQQDPIRLKNLLRQVERTLADRGLEPAMAREVLEPALGLLDDRSFWQRQGDGLALFLRPGFMRSFRLPLRFEERATVADQFCLQPLFPVLTGDGDFYLLALSQRAPRLFKGSRFQFDEVPLKNVPAGIAEVTQNVERQRAISMHSGGGRGLFHGHGDAGDLKRDALLDYFRQVNRGVRETLGDSWAPLLLAGVESQFPLYREVNTYTHLLETGIPGNPDEATAEDLHHQGWELVAPLFRREQQEAAAAYERLVGAGRAVGSVASVLQAAAHGRVESLFIPAGRSVWGRFDAESGEVVIAGEQEAGSVDLLNLAAIYTYQQKGAVYAVPPHQIPSNEEVAAVLRY